MTKTGTRTLAIGAAALLTVSGAQGVSAQAWIGQVVGDMMAQQQAAAQQAACMRGVPPVEEERIEALGPANDRLQAYYRAMQAGDALPSTFYTLDKKARWTHGATVLDQATLDRADDPLAATGLILLKNSPLRRG